MEVTIYIVGGSPQRFNASPGETVKALLDRVSGNVPNADKVQTWYHNGTAISPSSTMLSDGMVIRGTPKVGGGL